MTVSAILNDRYKKLGISEKTAERVRAYAEEMGYVPNQNALSMKQGRSLTIGILSSALTEGWGARIMIGALAAIKASPYSLRIEAVQGAAEEKKALESLIGSRIEGLFCCNINPTRETDDFFKTATERYGVAVASTNCAFSFNHSRVESDNHNGVAQLMEHLIALGHRKITHLGGDKISEASRERSQAFLECLKTHQLEEHEGSVIFTDWDIEKARAQAHTLLSQADRPTAILCANDSIAASVLQVADELKLRVPKDLSVVGMTNERISSLTTPEITTVSIPWEEIGHTAVRSLIQSIDEKSTPAEDRLVRCDGEILPRKSTAAPAAT